jgi:hypothetical protein
MIASTLSESSRLVQAFQVKLFLQPPLEDRGSYIVPVDEKMEKGNLIPG